MIEMYDYVYGVAQLAAGILAIMVGFVCFPMLGKTRERKQAAWKPLLLGLILFVLEEVIGGLRTFGVVPDAGIWKFSVHIIVSAILALMIGAVVMQTRINKGWMEAS
jgi:hypothetical protein